MIMRRASALLYFVKDSKMSLLENSYRLKSFIIDKEIDYYENNFWTEENSLEYTDGIIGEFEFRSILRVRLFTSSWDDEAMIQQLTSFGMSPETEEKFKNYVDSTLLEYEPLCDDHIMDQLIE